jgi:hypothetical protein
VSKQTITFSATQLGTLIEQLAPLNNRWREGNQAEKVLTLWAIGDVLLNAIDNPGDDLLWEIQGRSYITRDLLRRSLIVRRGWEQQRSLAELVQGLSSFTVFREALPFLKGDREGIDAKTYLRVVALLKERDTKAAIAELKKLKQKHIGRQHHKGAGKLETKEIAQTFLLAMQQIENKIRTSVTTPWAKTDGIVTLSQLAMAIASDEVFQVPAIPTMPEMDSLQTIAGILGSVMRGGRANISAFRQQVGAARLMHAADLFNSLQSEQALAEWQRRNIGISPSPPILSMQLH